MGRVYRGRDTRLQRDVAVKVLPDHFANDVERLARFERDRGAGSALPNYDVAHDGQRFVMIQALSAASSVVVVLNWFGELDKKLAGK